MTASNFAQSSPILIVAAAALIDRDGRVLVQKRPEGSSHPGLWEFPGGKIETDESPEAALVRELREELGIAVAMSCLSPACFASETSAERHLLLLVFVCREWRGEPRPLQATELRWLKPAELDGLDILPADRPLIRLLDVLI